MSTPQHAMETALKYVALPRLEAAGFAGSMPHFRRIGEDGVDLLSFRFYSREAGFTVEIATCSRNGVTTNWGKHISPEQVTAKDLYPDLRSQMRPASGTALGNLFIYEEGRLEACALAVVSSLPGAEIWWARMRQSPQPIIAIDPDGALAVT